MGTTARPFSELVKMLDRLEEALPQMVLAYPDEGDFWAAFAGEADVLEEDAGEASTYVATRIGAMLRAVGKRPPDAPQG